jgi:tetratricopeptide (TPR) repeat protein
MGSDGMDKLKALLARNRNQGPPLVRASALPPPFVARLTFRAGLRDLERKKTGEFQVKSTVRPAIEHGVAPRTSESLRPIDLTEIATKVNYIHKGRVLFARIVDDPYRIIGTNVLIEDDSGNCVHAGIYNYLLASEEPLDFFPKGTHLAFLEPYMRHSQDNPSAPLILRCDNPQCVRRFPSKSAWMAAKTPNLAAPPTKVSPSVLRQKGNQLFESGQLDQARTVYTEAVSISGIDRDDEKACFSNRAEINLRLQQWEAVEADARSALAIDPDYTKARYRLARALLRLNKIDEGQQIIAQLANDEVKDKSLQAEASRLLRESEGQYDIAAMRKEQDRSMVYHADFVSNAVKIGVLVERPTIGKYRGCVTTKAIAEGALITASKAFAFVPESLDNSELQFQVSPHTNQLATRSSLTLANEIVTLLHRRPQLAKRFYRLSDGADESIEPVHCTMIDLGKIRNIQSANSFGVYAENADLNSDWLRIQKESQFGRLLTEEETRLEREKAKISRGAGIWIVESSFNHSCNANCTWSQINDHMFIRSNRPIAENEELTIGYAPPEMSYTEKSKVFATWIRPDLGFSCACDYCATLRSDTKQREMEAEVHSAYNKAAQMVTVEGIEMAKAAERVLPERRRLEILSAHDALPPALCHRAVEQVEIMQGTVLQQHGKLVEAYRCYERASAIEYAVTGASYRYAKSLWRLVGSAMSCGRREDAIQQLHRIKNLPCFEEFPKHSSEGEDAFIFLTISYALPWWQDDHRNQATLEQLACRAWRSS